MRQFIFALGLCALLALPAFAVGVSEDDAARAEWRDMVVESDHAYSERQRAILKIDDAIYMDAGQTAWLVHYDNGRSHFLWTLEEPQDYTLAISYQRDTAPYHIGNQEQVYVLFEELYTRERTLGIVTGVEEPGDMLAYQEEHDSYVIQPGVELTAHPAQLSPGTTGLRATVFNQNHPAAEQFEGLLWYDYNPTLIVEARFEPLDEFVPETFQTSRGWYKEFQHMGNAVFSVGGEEFSMPLYGFTTEPTEVDTMSAFFTDAMSGAETYGVGRYLDVEIEVGSFPPATVTLDFNYAYNPLCARSSYYNCPYAEYDIPLPIRAGEMKPADH